MNLLKKKYLILLFMLILVIGCAEQGPEPIKAIQLPGHGQQVYAFTHDIRESLEVPANNEVAIYNLVQGSDNLNIVFNGTSQEDGGYFSVVVFNTVSKLITYFTYEGKVLNKFPTAYYLEDGWYNATGDKIISPVFEGPTLWMLGPNTGAKGTGLILINNTIYLHGTTYENLTMAAGKFVLTVMGISSLEDLGLE